MKTLLTLTFALAFTAGSLLATEPAPTAGKLTVDQLRRKNTKDLVQYAEEAFQEVQAANLNFMLADKQRAAAETALAKSHENYNGMYAWALTENERANSASVDLWKAQEKHRAALKKLFIYRAIMSSLVFIVVFLLIIQLTQYLMPPYSFGIPLAAATIAAAGIWIFL